MAGKDRLDWLGNYAFVLEPDLIRRIRHGQDYAAYTGSRWLALPWLILVAAMSGAFGGLAVSSSLWAVWWQVLLLPFLYLAFFTGALALTMRVSGRMIAGLVGWCVFFGTLIGVFTMWAAQTDSSFWAYAIAGGLTFFLLGITSSQLPPPGSSRSEEWFLTSSAAAPVGSCLAAWLYRNHLPEPNTLISAGITGALAATIFMGVAAALYFHTWQPKRGLLSRAMLQLHSDKTASEAVPLLTAAARSDGSLLALRGLAHALSGNRTAAESDWGQAGAPAAALSQGWFALRSGDPAGASTFFEAALGNDPRSAEALLGLGLARLRSGDGKAALAAFRQIPSGTHGALSLTHLAEAQLAAGDARQALATATEAIEEARSTHGRSWLVRADAHRAHGDIDSAALDYNRAIWAADESGIEQAARDRLGEIGRPVIDEYDEDDEPA